MNSLQPPRAPFFQQPGMPYTKAGQLYGIGPFVTSGAAALSAQFASSTEPTVPSDPRFWDRRFKPSAPPSAATALTGINNIANVSPAMYRKPTTSPSRTVEGSHTGEKPRSSSSILNALSDPGSAFRRFLGRARKNPLASGGAPSATGTSKPQVPPYYKALTTRVPPAVAPPAGERV